MNKIIIAIVLCSISFSAISAKPELVSRQQFDEWFDEISNWGRWGKDDELGTLNLITPEIRSHAASLASEGISISLALDLGKAKSEYNPHPLELTSWVRNVGGQTYVFDEYAIQFHGPTHSHLDGLAHVIHKGNMYNGISADSVGENGTDKLGVQNMQDGIVTRGVLVDMAWFRGVNFLELGEAITVADLESWEEQTGVTIRAGDALLIRTGRWVRTRELGPSHMVNGASGLHASVAKWLKQRDVAVLGADGGNDVLPSGVEGVQAPLHELAIAGLGMPVLDSLDLERLASEALKQKRWEFLFIAAPLRVQGGTGAPINPLAVF